MFKIDEPIHCRTFLVEDTTGSYTEDAPAKFWVVWPVDANTPQCTVHGEKCAHALVVKGAIQGEQAIMGETVDRPLVGAST